MSKQTTESTKTPFACRIDADVHQRIKDHSKATGIPMTRIVEDAVRAHLPKVDPAEIKVSIRRRKAARAAVPAPVASAA